MVKLYLDGGHGGKDSGATGNGLLEKNLTLEITKKIAQRLKEDYLEVEILQSRESDIYLSLDQRTEKANKWGADIFLSVHINANPNPSGNGFETHIYNENVPASTIALQNVLHAEIWNKIKGFAVTDRGKKRSNFHVLRESRMNAILTENLFITNPNDSSKLKNDKFIEALVEGHVIGLEKFVGLKKSQQPPREPTRPQTTGQLFKVQAGAFADRDNAEALIEKLKKDGYSAFLSVE
jgi:N-acetylmuramoyl-L-alanine amidase